MISSFDAVSLRDSLDHCWTLIKCCKSPKRGGIGGSPIGRPIGDLSSKFFDLGQIW